MQKYIIRLKQSKYIRDISTLMTGSGIAQFIPLITAPILARIYSSTDFGIYAIYYSVSTIIVAISTLKYEAAIYLPTSNRKAINLLSLCIITTIIISLIMSAVIFVGGNFVINKLELSGLGTWVHLIPAFILLSGVYNSFNLWFLRFQEYKFLSKNKVILAISTAIIQISIGILDIDWIGLILASVLGQLLAVLIIFREFISRYKRLLRLTSLTDIKKSVKDYRKFPIYTMPSDLVNNIAGQLPVFFISSLFGKEILGYYSIGQRFVALPLAFLSNSIQEVFRQRASADFNKYKSAREIFLKTLKTLSILAIIGIFVIILMGPIAFSLVLGDEWRYSGELMQIIGVLIMIRFVAGPLSYMMLIANKHQYDLIWQLALILFTTASFLLSKQMNYSIKETLAVFTLAISALYILNIYLSYNSSEYAKTSQPNLC